MVKQGQGSVEVSIEVRKAFQVQFGLKAVSKRFIDGRTMPNGIIRIVADLFTLTGFPLGEITFISDTGDLWHIGSAPVSTLCNEPIDVITNLA